jgi:hypothetical protein
VDFLFGFVWYVYSYPSMLIFFFLNQILTKSETKIVAGFYKMWMDYINLRKHYFRSAEFQSTLNNRTVLVTGLPEKVNSDEKFTEFVQALHFKYPPVQCVLNRTAKESESLSYSIIFKTY